ncbi:MAG TPA: 16S rRNA (adenine(1518)-N(6)/adenine(1519)-N(6))-dimethyltransferase RsmA [Methanomassiliicoccales archaeon]|nr:16S rRNA (adenine(1518)-N(6)/adenine(1519)-N(6))-dimethyltransferase RsmA [Methanomassiliicoccales archaeon]
MLDDLTMLPSEIKGILEQYGVTPTKAKGQNFLMDERVAEREVDYLDLDPRDTVLEVGPGLGILTDILLERAERVIAIELDRGMAEYSRNRYGDSIVFIEGDALKIPFPGFDRFISNIPYSISSPLIFKLLEHRFRKAVVMVQREFADRMVASPGTGDYSRLSVNMYYRAECEILEKVPKSRFWPEPEVDSAVVSIIPRRPPFRVVDEEFYLNLVNSLFQHRRKKIRTILKMKKLVDKDRLSSLPFLDERVEVLSPEEIGELSDAILSP